MKRLFIALLSCIALVSCDDKDTQPGVYDPNEPEVTPGEPGDKPSNPNNSDLYGTLPILHTEGRWLCDANGNHVNLHGFWQTYTWWFNSGQYNENNWGGKDYEGCVTYNKRIIDGVIASGLKVDFLRMHLDPYWFVRDGRPQKTPVSDYFSESLMKEYFEKVYLPIIKHCNSKGLYVVLRPYPCGEENDQPLKYGDNFFKMLESMWSYFSSHPYIRNNGDVMFELINEPVSIDASADGGDRSKAVSRYMQHFIDLIRYNCKNIIWVPGLTWQQEYNSFVKYPLKGDNLGFAVHCYPGWYGSDAESSTGENGGNMGEGVGGGYEAFQGGWNSSIAAAAELHPIMITEMDWAAAKYNKTWGKSFTGLAGGAGFGANFKYIMDKCGNVSYITFTDPRDLTLYPTESQAGYTNYWNDPECCPWQIYHWYEEYAKGNVQPESADYLKLGLKTTELRLSKGASKEIIVNAIRDNAVFPLQTGVELSSDDASIVRVDGSQVIAVEEGETTITAKALGKEVSVKVVVPHVDYSNLFRVTSDVFDVNICGEGTFDEENRCFTTGQYGFAGWKFDAMDISMHKYIVVKLGDKTDFTGGPSFRLFDQGYYDECYQVDITSTDEVRIPIADMKETIPDKWNGGTIRAFNTKTINIIGFWTFGGKTVQIDKVYFED
ncbi:MAG: cellulase family glycosylhydrolase [Bacteroidia bacterium]|nr:cellulase family glycosylhydrolase [Bacteroidia bacterium]